MTYAWCSSARDDKTLAREASGMGCQGQLTVKQYAEVHCFSRYQDVDIPKLEPELMGQLV